MFLARLSVGTNYIFTKLGVDSSNHFSFRARIHKVTDTQSHRCNWSSYPWRGWWRTM